MTLIDTPGLNDTHANRTDKHIHIETMRYLRSHLGDSEQGISSLILCFMPNKSERITRSVIECLVNMLFVFNSLDYRTDIADHPKIHIIFNDVSRNEENAQSQATGKDLALERIDEFKDKIKETVKRFYLFCEISDNTKIGAYSKKSDGDGNKVELLEWKDVKIEVCGGKPYKTASWFT